MKAFVTVRATCEVFLFLSTTPGVKQVLLEEGWPRGEMPSKSELREHMLACAALRYKVGLVYHGNAAETGEYLYDPNYTPTRDIEQVVHTLSAMFKPTSVEPELRQGL